MSKTYRDKSRGQKAGHHSRRWRELRAAILAANDTCWMCGRPGADTVDHLLEVAKGGDPFDLRNLAPAHGKRQPWGCPGNYGRSGRKTQAQPLHGSRDW